MLPANLVKCKDQIKKWAVAAFEDDISGFFGVNAGNIVLSLKEEILDLLKPQVIVLNNFLYLITFEPKQISETFN